jgi:hypothetical protein
VQPRDLRSKLVVDGDELRWNLGLTQACGHGERDAYLNKADRLFWHPQASRPDIPRRA